MSKMTEEQKLRKKKNILIILFMILLLVFVGIICAIFIWMKLHPKKVYDDPNLVPIETMTITDYQSITETPSYKEVTESTKFQIIQEGKKVLLVVNENNEIVNSETNEKVEILFKDEDINNNVSIIYQSDYDSLILTTDGKLYKLLNSNLDDGNQLNVKQVLSNKRIKNITKFNIPGQSTYTYVLTTDNKVMNTNTQQEYDRVIKALTTENGIIYVYDDYSFGFEKGKIVTNPDGTIIKFNILFKNILIDEKSKVYELDYTNKTVKTSSLGTMNASSYMKLEVGEYHVNVETNTGLYEFVSDYYYTK